MRFTWNYNKIKSYQQDFTCVIYLQYSLFMHHQYKTKTRLVDHWSGPQKLFVKPHWNHLHVNDAIITSLKLLACHIRLFKLFVGIEKDSWDEMILSVVRFNWMVRILKWRTIGINSWYLTTHNTSKLNWAQSSSDLFSSVCLVVNFSHFIFSRTTGPISTKLGTKHPWVMRTKVCSNEGPHLFQGKIITI